MRRGRREKPVISLASIEAALKGFGYGSREHPDAASLETLALVDLRLAEFSRPSAENLRAYTLQLILADYLLENLNEERRLFDLAPVHEKASLKESEKHLSEIMSQNSFSMRAWACLYYRYLRADLGFTVEAIATALGFGLRNFPRHHDDGLRLLRNKLISDEWNARKQLLRTVLRHSIPETLPRLIGREKALDSAAWALQQNPPMPVFITGAEGIGKTALAANLAKQLIDADALDYLVWLSRPKRLEEIYNALEDGLLSHPSRINWRSLLGEDSLLLVLDDISQLHISLEDCERLNGLLSPSYLIITNREFQPILKVTAPIPLKELEYPDNEKLIATYLGNQDLLDKIPLEQLGGNPYHLAYSAQVIRAGYRPQKALQDLRLLYDKQFVESSEANQMAWLSMAAGLDEDFLDKSLSAKNYIMQRYREDKALQARFQDYLREIEVPIKLMLTDWLRLEDDFVLAWMMNYEAKSIGELRQWISIADHYLETGNTVLGLRYGIALRRLNHRDAESYLEQVIQHMGQVGDFAGQAAARYELGLLYQSQAKFEKALGHYDAIEAYKQIDEHVKQNILLQRARIAIEQGDGGLALKYLQKTNGMNQTKVLEAEIYLLLGDFEKSQVSAYAALKEVEDNPQLAASLHTILGRSSQSKQAIEHLNAALSLSEQFNSDFDIARAKTNLAVAYLSYEVKEFDEAEELLRQARKIQSHIQDALGLSVTNTNLSHLQRLRLKS